MSVVNHGHTFMEEACDELTTCRMNERTQSSASVIRSKAFASRAWNRSEAVKLAPRQNSIMLAANGQWDLWLVVGPLHFRVDCINRKTRVIPRRHWERFILVASVPDTMRRVFIEISKMFGTPALEVVSDAHVHRRFPPHDSAIL